ncbi:MAG: transposase, partial [Azovibrio sp.]|uniref:ISL3 family transposase n=1 Tax=Azovibrio sp. TaxID=1872673 RepID=UPI003C75D432
MEKARKGLRAELTLKQKRGLMHDRFVLLKRERDLSDEERLNLDGWTKNCPALGEAYRLKEAFYALYEDSDSPASALRRYEAWRKEASPEIRPYFHDLIRAFTNWQPFILNYFDPPVPNACTESLNSLSRHQPARAWVQLRGATGQDAVHRRHPQPQAGTAQVRERPPLPRWPERCRMRRWAMDCPCWKRCRQ